LQERYSNQTSLTYTECQVIEDEIRRIRDIGSKAVFLWSYFKKFSCLENTPLHKWKVITDDQISIFQDKQSSDMNFLDRVRSAISFSEMNMEDISFFLDASDLFLHDYCGFHKFRRESNKRVAAINDQIPGSVNDSEIERDRERFQLLSGMTGLGTETLELLRPMVNSLFSYFKNTTDKVELKRRYNLSDQAIDIIEKELQINPSLFIEVKQNGKLINVSEISLCSLYRIAHAHFLQTERDLNTRKTHVSSSCRVDVYQVFEESVSFAQLEGIIR